MQLTTCLEMRGPRAELTVAFHAVEGDDGLCASRAWLGPLLFPG